MKSRKKPMAALTLLCGIAILPAYLRAVQFRGGFALGARENVVVVNGRPLAQEMLDRASFAAWVPPVHELGAVVMRESGYYSITYSPGVSPLRTIPAVTLPAGYYFLLGRVVGHLR